MTRSFFKLGFGILGTMLPNPYKAVSPASFFNLDIYANTRFLNEKCNLLSSIRLGNINRPEY